MDYDAAVISIHALREEGDQFKMFPVKSCRQFLSTPSARRATFKEPTGQFIGQIFLSTPSARRATDAASLTLKAQIISIHALREEGDVCRLFSSADRSYFYPRPPRGGRLRVRLVRWEPELFLSTPSARRATWRELMHCPELKFLSTPSARRATSGGGFCLSAGGDFYPRPPRGGRRINDAGPKDSTPISIHALREEGD